MKKLILTICLLFILSGFGLFLAQQDAEAWERQEVEVKDFGGFYCAYMNFNGHYGLLGPKSKIFKKEFERQGLKAVGPMFVTFYNPPWKYRGDDLRWAICYYIEKDTKVLEPVRKREVKKVKAVVLVHTGPGREIKESFDRVQDHIKEQKFTKVWPAYEVYHTDPPGIGVIHPVKK
jgi:effector-binding domain-containing protein